MAKKTLYFDCICGNQSYAAVENGKLTEFSYEKRDDGSLIGNIYKGKVTNVLNGMQAAFVDCGLERNCYISVEDLHPDRSKYDGEEIDIPSALDLNVGDEILVQVVKAPVGKKGAKITTNLSFIGKYYVYLPTTPFLGVSRKISDEELRRSLLFGASRMIGGREGLIVRTAAPYADRRVKLFELDYYRGLYKNIKAKFAEAPVGALLYSDYSLYIRVLRDTLSFDIDKIYVGTPELEQSVKEIVKLTMGGHRGNVILHNDGTDMFYSLGLTDQLMEITGPRVNLDNGAYLVIEKTEALTVIDVNTGRFTGDDSLEQTVYYTNILAAREIARQVRLRNIGGIVVVDFIDMNDPNHQKSLVQELENALAADKSKCHVLPMSKFGLVEFTRKRAGISPTAAITKPCKYCHGVGFTLSQEFILHDLRAKLLDVLSKGNRTVVVDCNFEICNRMMASADMIESVQSLYPHARVYLTGHRTYHEHVINLRVETGPTITLPPNSILMY